MSVKFTLALIILLSLAMQSMTAVIAIPAMPAEHAVQAAQGSVTESSGTPVPPCHETAGRSHSEGSLEAVPETVMDFDVYHDTCADLCFLGVCCAFAPASPASEPALWALPLALGAADEQPAVAVTEQPFRPPISTLP